MMQRILILVALLVGLAVLPQPAPVQAASDLVNRKIEFTYLPPTDVKYQAVMERMQKSQVLEMLSQFLSPLRFPHAFYLVTSECGEANAYYNPDYWMIVICYEFFELIEAVAPRPGVPVEGYRRDEVVAGAFVGIILHEAGHAVFDMFNVPVFGREEDAADEMAGFIALQFNKDVARTIVRGYAFLWWEFARRGEHKDWADFSDEHGTHLQRFYNVLCMGYGGDPETFREFIDKGMLPRERAANCANEFAKVKSAFAKTILPFVDREMMKKVQETQWLK